MESHYADIDRALEREVTVNGYHEPGNGTSYALAALRLTAGEWPGTKGMTLPVLVSWEHAGAFAFDLGPGVLHASYIKEKLHGSVCDASAIVRWLDGFPGAEFEAVISCECNRH
jgi:hypothetical protein